MFKYLQRIGVFFINRQIGRNATTPEELLFSFYEVTFKKNLRIVFQRHTISRFNSFNNYINHTYPVRKANLIYKRLNQYQTTRAPMIKIKPLLHFLIKNKLRPISMLDFGCGNGVVLKILTNKLPSLQLIVGVDNDEHILPTNLYLKNKNSYKIYFARNIKDSEIVSHRYDLITVIHTFHHLSKEMQLNVLDDLLYLLRPGGLLYVYEDSWSESNPCLEGELRELDLEFSCLHEIKKVELFQINDYWSNVWCYGRSLNPSETHYWEYQAWLDFFQTKELNISSGIMGFNQNRLHGVPSCWFILRKL